MWKSTLSLLIFVLFSCNPVPAHPAQTTATFPAWQEIAPGLAFLRWPVHSASRELLDVIAILRVQPERWAFRVFYQPTPKTLPEWQQATGAPIILNGGFFQENYKPAGRILVNGASLGPFRNRSMKGMFLSEPKRGVEKHPKALLIDLKGELAEETIARYDQGVQSFPILLDPKGQVRVNPSNFRANRTVIAQDRPGNILILITEKPYFTLYELGNYLKQMPLGIAMALNLDGGYRTQLAVQVGRFKYLHAGQGDTGEAARLLFPEGTVKLPTVIGIFPREETR